MNHTHFAYSFQQIANLCISCYHSLQAFWLEPLGKSNTEAPWVLVVSPVIALMQDQAKKLSRIADVVPIVLFMEEAGLTAGDT